MFIYEIHASEPWIERNFQCMILDGIDASLVVARKAWNTLHSKGY